MCGCCIESAYFQGLLDHSDDLVSTRMLQHIHLQESPDWFEYHQIHQGEMTQLDDMIVLCRGWDEYFFRPGRRDALSLKSRMAPSRWSTLAQWLRPYAPSPGWEWVLEVEWIGIDPDIETAVQLLYDYRRSCLPHRHYEKLPRRVSGIRAFARAEQLFWVYIALMLSDRFDPKFFNSTIVAIELPKRVPAFDGLDLWIQRRAAMACVRRGGTGFLNAHKESIRDEIVSSVAMGVRVDADYLAGLEQVIRRKDDWGA